MSIERRALPRHGYVATTTGPCLVGALAVGDELVLVKADGSLGSAPIAAIEDIGLLPCTHILSKAGHLVAPIGSRITTSTGPHTTEDILLETRATRRVRLEILSHRDLPRVRKPASAKRGAASAFALFDGQVLIPQPVAAHPLHEHALAELLTVHGEPVHRIATGVWLVLQSRRRLADLAPGRPADLAAEADALTTLMAWEPTGDGWCLRSPLTRVEWTQRALASLAAAGVFVAVAWQPGYLPVEARILLGAPLVAHYDVVAAQPGSEPCLGVDLQGRGSVVLCGAMVDARA